jgi:hypothetical protein
MKSKIYKKDFIGDDIVLDNTYIKVTSDNSGFIVYSSNDEIVIVDRLTFAKMIEYAQENGWI